MIIKRKYFLEHTYLKGFKTSLGNILFKSDQKKAWKNLKKVLPSHFELSKKDFPRPSHDFPCTSCELCVLSCPTNALELVVSNQIDLNSHLLEGPKPKNLYLDENKCIKCGLCVEICPTDALVLETSKRPLAANLDRVDLRKLADQ